MNELKILFIADVAGNSGPANVNRELISSWPKGDDVVVLSGSSKPAMIFNGVRKGLSCDVLVSAGSGWVDIVLHAILARLGKPVVCFNHGYVPYENEINGLGYSTGKIAAIEWHMRTSDAIVANSELQMRFVNDQLRGYDGKSTFANLGTNPFQQASTVRNNSRPIIAVSGGTRPVKGNEVVGHAVRILRSRGIDCELRVYGRDYATNEDLAAIFASGEAIRMGQVPQDEFVRQLGEADIFVMNSRHESFGLSAFDAIRAGCSLLLSRNCGITGVLALEDGDLVEDCENAVEVADRIQGLLGRSNAERLYRTLDFDTLSWKWTARKLRDVALLCCSEVTPAGAKQCE